MEDRIRVKKRIKIGTIYFAIALVIVSIFYFIIKPNPSCQDGIQNQGEQGIDCSGPCFPCIKEVVPVDLDVLSMEVVHDVDNKYDVAVKIKNTNEIFGASNIKFKIILQNENREEIMNREESKGYYILPKEEKHLIVQGIATDTRPSFIKIEISEVEWNKFSQYEEPRLIVLNSNYDDKPGEGGFAKITGTLVNKSRVDFETIKVNAVVQDGNGKLLATNYQIVNTIRANEQRDFIMFFPHEFGGSVKNIKIEPETNVFDSENYVRSYGSPEEWVPKVEK